MARLRVSDENATLMEVTLHQGVGYSVGRSPGSRITLDSPSVSKNHCRFHARDGTWWVEDIGSADGTFVNGERILEARALATDDRVRVGDYTILLESDDDSRPAGSLSLETRQPTPELLDEKDPHGFPVYSNQGPDEMRAKRAGHLVLVLEGSRPTAVKLDKDITLIGAGAHCDFRIDGLFVRREQAAVFKDNTGCRVICHGGFHPLRVNGEKVEEAYLVPGDVITVAGHRFSLKQI